MFNKLGLQLWTIRDYMKNAEDIDKSFGKMAELGYTEAHTAGNEIPYEQFGDLAKKHGIKIVGTHYNLNKILNEPEETIRVHRYWDTDIIGLGGMPGEARNNYDALMKFIESYNKAADFYAKEGFKLSYHNHSFEFIRIKDNKTIMDYLYENLDPKNISFVLDTCWVANGGADVRYWMEKLAGRIDIIHLKDLKVCFGENNSIEHFYTEIGNGNLYWDGIMETAEKIGVKSYVVEQDGLWIDNDPFKAAKISADYLKKYMK